VPEGDTVWRSARLLDRALTGKVLTRTDLRVPSFATWDLSGATVAQTLSRGKHLLTRIDAE
jgi:endonuclease VIII